MHLEACVLGVIAVHREIFKENSESGNIADILENTQTGDRNDYLGFHEVIRQNTPDARLTNMLRDIRDVHDFETSDARRQILELHTGKLQGQYSADSPGFIQYLETANRYIQTVIAEKIAELRPAQSARSTTAAPIESSEAKKRAGR